MTPPSRSGPSAPAWRAASLTGTAAWQIEVRPDLAPPYTQVQRLRGLGEPLQQRVEMSSAVRHGGAGGRGEAGGHGAHGRGSALPGPGLRRPPGEGRCAGPEAGAGLAQGPRSRPLAAAGARLAAPPRPGLLDARRGAARQRECAPRGRGARAQRRGSAGGARSRGYREDKID